MPRIAVILPDLLQGAGMTAILERYFSPAEVACFTRVQEVTAEGGNGVHDLYFTASDTFASHVDFFLPRRNQSVVLVGGEREPELRGGETPRVIATGCELENLLEKIERVLTPMRPADEGSTSDELSAREVQVLQLVVSGAINKEIAERLNISLNTVLTHRKNITAKLGIKTISGLTLYALMHGYIPADEMPL